MTEAELTIDAIDPECPGEPFPPSLVGENTLREPNRIIDANRTIWVEFTYPLGAPVVFELTTESPNGWTAAAFISALQDTYAKIYREEEASTSVPIVPRDQRGWLANRNATNGKYAIWGHDIGDLVLESFEVRDGIYRLGIGS